MRTRRLSIAGLMGIVLVSAICLGALLSGSFVWAGILFLVTTSILTLAIVGAICRDGSERAWWLGFALFGWGYLALVTLQINPLSYIADTSLFIFRRLATTSLFESIWSYFYSSSQPAARTNPLSDIRFYNNNNALFLICHCLFSLLSVAVGGGLAEFLFGGPTSPVPADCISGEDASSLVHPGSRRRTVAMICVALARIFHPHFGLPSNDVESICVT